MPPVVTRRELGPTAYRVIFSGSDRYDAAAGATYVLRPNSSGGTLASAATAGTSVVYVDPADFALSGFSTKYRVVTTVLVNATAPGVNFTAGLYPVSAPTGGAATLSITTGTVQAGSTIAVNAPSLGTLNQGNSGDFTPPVAGYYCLGVVVSGAMTASSAVTVQAQLRVRNV